jgi:hypothetical protein
VKHDTLIIIRVMLINYCLDDFTLVTCSSQLALKFFHPSSVINGHIFVDLGEIFTFMNPFSHSNFQTAKVLAELDESVGVYLRFSLL